MLCTISLDQLTLTNLSWLGNPSTNVANAYVSEIIISSNAMYKSTIFSLHQVIDLNIFLLQIGQQLQNYIKSSNPIRLFIGSYVHQYSLSQHAHCQKSKV